MKDRYFTIGVYLAAAVALIDQGCKWWMLNSIFKSAKIVPVTSFLNYKLSWNKGVTFGLFNDHGDLAPYILSAVAIAILLLLLNWLRKADTYWAGFGLGLVMGGAIGNVVDRLRYGSVVDFLDFHLGGYHWYTFNPADSAIVCGVGLLLLENLIAKRRKR